MDWSSLGEELIETSARAAACDARRERRSFQMKSALEIQETEGEFYRSTGN